MLEERHACEGFPAVSAFKTLSGFNLGESHQQGQAHESQAWGEESMQRGQRINQRISVFFPFIFLTFWLSKIFEHSFFILREHTFEKGLNILGSGCSVEKNKSGTKVYLSLGGNQIQRTGKKRKSWAYNMCVENTRDGVKKTTNQYLTLTWKKNLAPSSVDYKMATDESVDLEGAWS